MDWKTSSPTLVLALSSSCRFCIESIPFYQKLAELKKRGSNQTRFVAVFPQPEAEAKEFLLRNKIVADEIVSIPLPEVGIEGTPTLLLVDSEGKVTKNWIGMLSETREREVIAALTNN